MSQYTIEEILNLEKEVWQGLVSGDKSVDARLLSDDFLGVYASGFSNKQEHMEQLDGGPSVDCYELTDVRLKTLRSDTVLLSYLALYTRSAEVPFENASKMYISSIWKRVEDGWKNTFSQDSNVELKKAHY